MASGDDSSPADRQRRSEIKLRQLAELLDCPVEVFTDGVNAPSDVRQLREIIELWGALDPEDREELLRHARTLAKAA